MGQLEGFSYEAQLGYLHNRMDCAASGGEKLMLMSLAESVKAARDHDLNCNRDAFKSGWDKGVKDCIKILDLVQITGDFKTKREVRDLIIDMFKTFLRSNRPAIQFLHKI